MIKKISKGKYELTAPNGDVWILENYGYGRGFGAVRWVAKTTGVGTKFGATQLVRGTRSELVDVINYHSPSTN